jgi:parallel beta-helix repeat protein
MRRTIILCGVVVLVLTVLAPAAQGTSGTMVVTSDTTLTEDHDGNIVIDADDVTLDCAGFSVNGNGEGTGIVIDAHTGVTITKCVVAGHNEGIAVVASSDVRLIDNLAQGNVANGFNVVGSSGSTFTGNRAIANDLNGFEVRRSDGNVFKGNTARGSGDWGFAFVRSSRNILRDNESLRNQGGFSLIRRSERNVLRSNKANHNLATGITAWRSGRGVWDKNRAMENGRFGFLLSANYYTVTRNAACRNGKWDALDTGYANVWRANDFCKRDI